MTCHLINKAVMKQNCIEALNQHAQPLEKKAALANFTRNFGNCIIIESCCGAISKKNFSGGVLAWLSV